MPTKHTTSASTSVTARLNGDVGVVGVNDDWVVVMWVVLGAVFVCAFVCAFVVFVVNIILLPPYDYAFWAGWNNGLSGYNRWNFSVSDEGILRAKGAEISGTITATSGSFTGTINASSGTIGGFTIGEHSIMRLNPTDPDGQNNSLIGMSDGRQYAYAFWAGYNETNTGGTSRWNFSVQNNGKLTATNADISGTINATSGSFTGVISASTISGSTISGTTITGGTISGTTIKMTENNGYIQFGDGCFLTYTNNYGGSDNIDHIKLELSDGTYISLNSLSDTLIVHGNLIVEGNIQCSSSMWTTGTHISNI